MLALSLSTGFMGIRKHKSHFGYLARHLYEAEPSLLNMWHIVLGLAHGFSQETMRDRPYEVKN